MTLKNVLSKVIKRAKSPSVLEGTANPVKSPNSTEFEVDGWIISEFVVSKIIPIVGYHPFPLQELMLMTSTVCRLRPPLIFEWGTHIGKSARIFYETIKYFDIDSHIHSVDLPDEINHVEHPHDKRGALVNGISRVSLHQGDGVVESLRIWEQNGSCPNPLFFVDGDHSYQSVRREVDLILGTVPKASLLLHDTFYQSQDAGYNIGPHQAILETIDANPQKYKTINSGLSLPGLTLLYHRE